MSGWLREDQGQYEWFITNIPSYKLEWVDRNSSLAAAHKLEKEKGSALLGCIQSSYIIKWTYEVLVLDLDCIFLTKRQNS